MQCFRAALSAVRQDETEAFQASGAMAHPVFKNHGMGKNVCAAMFNRVYAFNVFSVHISASHFIIFAVSLIVCFPCLLFAGCIARRWIHYRTARLMFQLLFFKSYASR